MQIVKILVLVVVLAVGVCLGLAILQPATYHVERSVTIAAPPPTVFSVVNDFHHWESWSPWAHLDPAMKSSYSGPESGKDAVYTWTGNNQVGTGKMTIVESTPDSHVGIQLDFIKPMAMTSQAGFTLAPAGEGTKVTWSMDGKNNFMGKFFSMFMNTDKMVGADFEKGLASLKGVAEKMPAPPAAMAADSTKKS